MRGMPCAACGHAKAHHRLAKSRFASDPPRCTQSCKCAGYVQPAGTPSRSRGRPRTRPAGATPRKWYATDAEFAVEAYRNAVENNPDDSREEWTNEAVGNLAEDMDTEFEENCPKLDGCYGDMLTAALGEVNWHEIARNYIEELDRDEIEKDHWRQQ